MLRALCPACLHGQHAYHQDVPRSSVPGLIGSGHECPCRGECREDQKTAADRAEIRRVVRAALSEERTP